MFIYAVACSLALQFVPICSALAEEPLSVEERTKALNLLSNIHTLESQKEIVSMGKKVLPILWEECTRPNVSDRKLAHIFSLVARIPGDRSLFINLAGKQLSLKGMSTIHKITAINLIKETHSSKYAPDVAKLIGGDYFTSVEAARALAVIGTERELSVLQAWLKKNLNDESDPFRQQITEAESQFRKRLAEEKK